ncbi:hypothetical protein LSH36_261g03002 [Paralvinella palmiformis]|uniref:Uncharacterized protein n=1 Tax=Paralvinella palmiformis TaxID=53620 RepID=A0AAD9JL01_9ANNE|nr:hypothetical protein LSH36_261g03002 [Paralvinella palmiformis]
MSTSTDTLLDDSTTEFRSSIISEFDSTPINPTTGKQQPTSASTHRTTSPMSTSTDTLLDDSTTEFRSSIISEFDSTPINPTTGKQQPTSASTHRTRSTASSTRGRSSASRITSSTLLKEFTIGTESAIVTESDSTSSYLSTEQQQLTTSSIDQPHPRALPLVIIISVPVVILVLLIVVVALLIWRCGRHNNSPSEDSKQTQNWYI